jgi:long-chain acyl-CoA synthetase
LMADALVNQGASLDTFPKLLLHHAERRGDRPAIREKRRGLWRTLTWRALADEVEVLATALAARGVAKGSRVAFIGDNRPRLFAGICATQALGAVAMPLFQDATAEEILEPLRAADVTHVFAENQEQVDKLLAILPQCPALRCIVFDDDRSMGHYRQPCLVHYDMLLAAGGTGTQKARASLRDEIARGSGTEAAFLSSPRAPRAPPRASSSTVRR